MLSTQLFLPRQYTGEWRKDQFHWAKRRWVLHSARSPRLLESWICKSVIQVPGPDFSMYTRGNPSSLSQPSTNENVLENWNATKNAPVVWFVSHCKDYNGRWEEKSYVNPIFIRMKYVRWLQKFIGVHIYGDCGNYKCGKVFNVQLEIMLSCRATTVIVSFLVTQPIPASKYEPGGLLHTPRPLLWDGQQKIQVKKHFMKIPQNGRTRPVTW